MSENREIKNIVFDVGEVLVSFDFRQYMRDLGFSEDAVEALAENMVLTEFWNQMDLGNKMQADAREEFPKLMPQYANEIKLFWDNIKDIVVEFDYAQPLIKRIKEKGYNVYILSNYPVEMADVQWPTFKFLPETDGHIVSGYERIAKPDPRIYRLLESRYGINLAESMFVDDRQVNIDGAEAVGMTGLLFTGYDKFVRKLEEMQML